MGHKAVSKFFSYLAIIATLCLSVSTIIANQVDFFPPQKYFFINLLAFGLPFLLLFNILLFGVWCIFKWKIAIFPLIAILFSLPFVNRVYQFQNKKAIITNSKSNDLFTIATYNMFGTHFDKKKLISIATNFSELNTDIICLEEFSPPKNHKDSIFLQNTFIKWPYHLSTIKSGILPICIYSKYPIINPHRIHFLPERNNFVYCDVLLPQTSIRLFAIHLQTTRFNRERANIKKAINLPNNSREPIKERIFNNIITHFKESLTNRQVQVDSLRTLIKQAKSEDCPTIVCGDFNTIASQYAYKRLINTGLQDGFVQCGNHLANTYRYLHQLLRIDYILYSKHFEPTAYQTFDWNISDHKAVVMQFKQPKKNNIR